MAQELGEDFDGLKKLQGLVEFLPTKQPYIGFGESAPVDGTHDDNAEEQADRRVEVLFFAQGQEPDIALLDEDPKVSELYHPDAFRRVEIPVGSARRYGTLDRIESTLALDQFTGLAKKRGEDFFVLWMATAFGGDIAEETYRALHRDLLAGTFPAPEIFVVDASRLSRRLGGYNKKTKKIEVAESVARGAAAGGQDESWTVLAILIEEFGHYVDDYLRVGDGDAKADEGARFAYSLLNLKWKDESEAEVARLVPLAGGPGTAIRVEWASLQKEIEEEVGQDAQDTDEQDEELEFFGKGRLDHDHNPHSWGHQAIEEAALTKRNVDRRIVNRIYFGNWLRDLSQALTPLTTRWIAPKVWATGIHVLSHVEFGQNSDFNVTLDILGDYDWQEHIDHPYGNPGVQDGWTRFDTTSLTPIYLGGPAKTPSPSAASYIKKQLELAVAAGEGTQGRRHLGQALHTLEDFFAHSNYVELTLRALGHTGVEPWTNARLEGEPPLVTGTFSTADTAASLILALAEHMSKAEDCEVYKSEPSWKIKLAFLLAGEILKGAEKLTTNKGEVEKLWDDWGDRAIVAVHYALELDILHEHPTARAIVQGAKRTFAYVQCKIGEQVSKFVAAVLAATAGELIGKVIEHDVSFDGTIGSVIHDLGSEIGHSQTAIIGSGIYPTHTQLAKDHDDHPFHDVAALMAVEAVGTVFDATRNLWRGDAKADPVATALSYLVHPRNSTHTKLIDIAGTWAGGNSAAIAKARTPTWVEHHRKEMKEARDRAHKIVEDAVGKAAADTFVEWTLRLLKDGAH